MNDDFVVAGYGTALDFESFRLKAGSLSSNGIYLSILYAQAYHETGAFKSKMFIEANNLFGMKIAIRRPQVTNGTYKGSEGDFASYFSIGDSIKDRIDLDQWSNTQPPVDLSDVPRYMEEVLRKGYAEDPIYMTTWTDLYKQLFGHYDGFDFGDISKDDDYLPPSGAVTIETNHTFLWKYGKYILIFIFVFFGYKYWKRFKK